MKKAKWIWLDKQAESDEYGAFYDEFYVSEVEGVIAKISVAGDYNLYLNGQLISFGQYPEQVTVVFDRREGRRKEHGRPPVCQRPTDHPRGVKAEGAEGDGPRRILRERETKALIV